MVDAPAEFSTYGQILNALLKAALTVARQIAADKAVMREDGGRNFAILSLIVRRVIAVSRQLRSLGVLNQPPKRGLAWTVQVALDVFAAHKIDAETHRAWMDADIDAERDVFSDIQTQRPILLVIELCRDFGMVAHAVPARFLDTVPSEIRLLAARAAAASLRPSKPSRGHLMSRSNLTQ